MFTIYFRPPSPRPENYATFAEYYEAYSEWERKNYPPGHRKTTYKYYAQHKKTNAKKYGKAADAVLNKKDSETKTKAKTKVEPKAKPKTKVEPKAKPEAKAKPKPKAESTKTQATATVKAATTKVPAKAKATVKAVPKAEPKAKATPTLSKEKTNAKEHPKLDEKKAWNAFSRIYKNREELGKLLKFKGVEVEDMKEVLLLELPEASGKDVDEMLSKWIGDGIVEIRYGTFRTTEKAKLTGDSNVDDGFWLSGEKNVWKKSGVSEHDLWNALVEYDNGEYMTDQKSIGLAMTVPDLSDEILKRFPSMTTDMVKSILKKWMDDEFINLRYISIPESDRRSKEGIMAPTGIFFFIGINKDGRRPEPLKVNESPKVTATSKANAVNKEPVKANATIKVVKKKATPKSKSVSRPASSKVKTINDVVNYIDKNIPELATRPVMADLRQAISNGAVVVPRDLENEVQDLTRWRDDHNPIEFPELYKKLKSKWPGLSLGQFQDSMRSSWDKNKIDFGSYTRSYGTIATTKEPIFIDAQVKYYVFGNKDSAPKSNLSHFKGNEPEKKPSKVSISSVNTVDDVIDYVEAKVPKLASTEAIKDLRSAISAGPLGTPNGIESEIEGIVVPRDSYRPITLPDLYKELKRKWPRLTLGQFQDSVRKSWENKKIDLGSYTRSYGVIARAREAMFVDGDVKYYAYGYGHPGQNTR